jgi:hypothetical protein
MEILAKVFRFLCWGFALILYGIAAIIILPIDALSELANGEEDGYRD